MNYSNNNVIVDGIQTFLKQQFPPREMILDPVLPDKGLLMLFAERGIGKTFVALSMANAIATGGQALRWHTPRPRRVLYIDGEMPNIELQKRLKLIIQSSRGDAPSDEFFRLITWDSQVGSALNLGTPEGQTAVDSVLGKAEVVFIDNLSTLCSYGKENEAESWRHVQTWLLKLRQLGISVVLVHHAGKNGSQRGTSRREDVLDTSIKLTRPQDYTPKQGARFEVHFEKARGIIGDGAAPFEAQLMINEEGATWEVSMIANPKLDLVREVWEPGMSARKVEELIGIPKSTAHRLIKQLELEA